MAVESSVVLVVVSSAGMVVEVVVVELDAESFPHAATNNKAPHRDETSANRAAGWPHLAALIGRTDDSDRGVIEEGTP